MSGCAKVCHCDNTICDCLEYNQTFTLACSLDPEPMTSFFLGEKKRRRKGQRRAHNPW